MATTWFIACALLLGGTLGMSTASAECISGSAGHPGVAVQDCLDTWGDGTYQIVADVVNGGPGAIHVAVDIVNGAGALGP